MGGSQLKLMFNLLPFNMFPFFMIMYHSFEVHSLLVKRELLALLLVDFFIKVKTSLAGFGRGKIYELVSS